MKVTPPEEKELVYSEAEDGKPKPIPVAEFAKYFRNKSSNGAIVLREEFKVYVRCRIPKVIEKEIKRLSRLNGPLPSVIVTYE